jgi:hypothetical protein
MFIVKTSASAYTSMLLKSSFVKVREHAKRSCSLIVTSCFITLSKTTSKFIASYTMSKYCFLKVLCLLQTTFRLFFTFTKIALFVRASNSMSLFVMSITVASFYSLICIVFRTASLCFINLVLFRIFVRFFYLLLFIQACFT